MRNLPKRLRKSTRTLTYCIIRKNQRKSAETHCEIKLIVELLDEASPKGVFKELNSEIRRDLAKVKAK